MSHHLERVLYKAAALTFEELGFLLPTPELDEKQASAPAEMIVSVSFHGPLAGCLVIAIGEELLPVLASNMLGEEEAPSLEQQQDGLREIANVVCGNVLPGIVGAKPVFQISPPQILKKGQAAGLQCEKAAAAVTIGLNQGRAELSLYLESQVRGPLLEEPS